MQRLFTIILMLIGVLSLVFLVLIISTSEEMYYSDEGIFSIDMFMYLAYLVFILSSVLVLIFTTKNVLNNPQKSKSTLKALGVFILMALISYFVLSKGEELQLSDGSILSVSESKLLESGLFLLYALMLVAGGSMLFFGIKKMMK